MSFYALITERDGEGQVSSKVQPITPEQLPEGEVLVEVEWTGLNYKDALCLTGKGGLVRNYPHVAGIDFAGRVIESADSRYHPGQGVVLTGWRVGENHWGGYAAQARVKADWLVPLPKTLSSRQAMMLGTAGLTAMLSINRLKGDGLGVEDGEVVVTGAGGGVGSISVMLLAALGHKVAAVSGRPELAEALKTFGADRLIGRDDIMTGSGKPLDKGVFAGAIDSVGGPMLAELLKKMAYNSGVAAVGNAGGLEFPGNILPFILRGVTLFGIDSVMQPYAARVAGWERLGTLFTSAIYEGWITEVSLGDLPGIAEKMLRGEVRGRVICNPGG